jgi:putative tryptophan/tyrosine transport system substrate-binding protein
VKRRQFISLLGGAAIWPLAGRAQQQAMPVVGSLFSVSAAQWEDKTAGFRRGLGEAGFVDGRNVAIDYRWADGQLDRMATMAADLIGRKVAVILAGGNTTGVRALIAATKTIPIVFTTASDPVAAGLVASLSRPGGNATGVTIFGGELVAKKLELLHEVVPNATQVAVLANPGNPVFTNSVVQAAQSAARRLGLEMTVINATTDTELDMAFAAAAQQRASAVLFEDAYFSSRRKQIAALGLRHSLPTMGQPDTIAAGVLIGYGPSIPDSYRQAGVYVGRILKGEKPGDLPVLQPTKFELVINLKTAKALGLDVPPTLLARADEVIE